MADFRVPLPDEPDGLARRELDWDRELSVWSLSEQEYGSSRWDLGQQPSAYDLGQLLLFFRMLEPVREGILMTMSPGACVAAHAEQTGLQDIVASLCVECGEHWSVYKLDEDTWRLYGRTCNFSWNRGRVVDTLSDRLLTSLLPASGMA